MMIGCCDEDLRSVGNIFDNEHFLTDVAQIYMRSGSSVDRDCIHIHSLESDGKREFNPVLLSLETG